jgi:hypothetical protein
MIRALRLISVLNGSVNLFAGRRAGSGVLSSAMLPVGVELKSNGI